MKILITGADGFIGSHLVEHFINHGYQVRALCLYNSFGSWGWLEHAEKSANLEVVLGDVRDKECCAKIMDGIDVVINLAALIAIPYSYVAPRSYVETNVTGTLNLCQAAVEKSVKRFVQISTSEVYGTAQYVPIDEHHPIKAQSPYSASKIGSDAVAMSHYYSFDLPVVLARPFNTFGPRQSARAVIPTIITQLAQGITEVQLGDTTPTRDFNYVKDTCEGLRLLAGCDAAVGEVINIGSGTEISIHDLFYKIARLMQVDAKIIEDNSRLRPEKSEVHRLVCNADKLVSYTGFKAQYGLDRGLLESIQWFQQNESKKHYKPDLYTV